MKLITLLKCLLCSYLATGIILAVFSLFVYLVNPGEGVISIAIMIIYVAATFLAGWLAGKNADQKKFLWGLVEGGAYFLVLAIVSLIASGDGQQVGSHFFYGRRNDWGNGELSF